MRALCWKELRENWRWALAAAIALGFAQWYALGQSQNQYTLGYSWTGHGILLDSTAFLAVTTFGSALAGLLLGFVQILPELRRDQWASLLHRPVGRGTVFRGKVAGGLLLYAFAVVPPFLLSVWRVATPGHFAAPFVPEMTLAGTADLCAGAAFYFAALAMALPRGGWVGVRAFPLLAAVHALYFVQESGLFRVAVEAAVLTALLLFTAGWATMLHQEKFSPRPWVGKLACLGVVFYGMCGLGDIAHSAYETIGPARHSRSSQYNLSDTGLPLRLDYVDNVLKSVTGPDGSAVTDKRFQPDQVHSHMHYLNRSSEYIGDSHGWKWDRYRGTYRDLYRYLSYNQAYAYPQPEQWFYLVERRVWISCSTVKKAPLASLDRRGFGPPSRPLEPFGEDSYYHPIGEIIVEYDQAGARLVDLPRRQITDLGVPGPIYGSGSAYSRQGTHSVTVFGLALADHLDIRDEHGAPVASLPYHQDVSRWGQISLGMTGDKEQFYLQYDPSAWLPWEERKTMPAYLEVQDAHGASLQTYTLPPLPPYWQSRAWPDYIGNRLQSPAFFFGTLLYQKLGALGGSKRLAGLLARRLGPDRELTREHATFIPLFSLALAAGTWFWARRTRFAPPRALAWTLFVLAGGLAGFVAFRAAADWPRFVPCFRCGRPREVDSERCPACGSGWPDPPSEGTEIFEREAAALATARA